MVSSEALAELLRADGASFGPLEPVEIQAVFRSLPGCCVARSGAPLIRGRYTVSTATIPDLRSVTPCRSAPGTRVRRQFSNRLLEHFASDRIRSEALGCCFDRVFFTRTGIHPPPSGQARGHASLENAIVLVFWLFQPGRATAEYCGFPPGRYRFGPANCFKRNLAPNGAQAFAGGRVGLLCGSQQELIIQSTEQ
jgi:hypothetical protein